MCSERKNDKFYLNLKAYETADSLVWDASYDSLYMGQNLLLVFGKTAKWELDKQYCLAGIHHWTSLEELERETVEADYLWARFKAALRTAGREDHIFGIFTRHCLLH